ncbi:sporulation protein [Pontibacillus halophilus JSM 076056 = DSM 19796]|uniref:Sporulation protein n=1 Tax=Pontibacillus halophilus JSM 076056 = DSM 19796 TaxID=1385510 RepID=A0A0A5GJU1_9BACI|nr:Spo0B domain-containing protein [Pontibacillus halophilus]KGX93491.1 sporulation protein [Pontibacillus halophilus JSM 076056 = DSM 19796]
MKADEVTYLLRHYRHDWMNQLQLIKGYASMDKLDKVKEKVNEIVTQSQQESHLMNLKADRVTLWILRFNTLHDQFRLTYTVEGQADLSSYDYTLSLALQSAFDTIQSNANEHSLYKGSIMFQLEDERRVSLSFTGDFLKRELDWKPLENLPMVDYTSYRNDDESTTYTILFDLNER